MSFNFEEIDEELTKLKNASRWYEGNLKNESEFYTLDQNFFLLTDCDDHGNLLLDKFVLVQFVGVKDVKKKIDYTMVCHQCNKDKESLLQVLRRPLDPDFLMKQHENYCIHARAAHNLKPEEEFGLSECNFPWNFPTSDLIDIQVLLRKPYLCAVYASGSYGIITFSKKSKNPKCILPHKNSATCGHVNI